MPIHVRAPCRLHFGMFGFGHAERPQFGGVGMMIDPPGLDVHIVAAAEFAARSELAERIEQIVQSLVDRWQLPALPRCEIIVHSPPGHSGLGVGTQLGLALAAGVRRFLMMNDVSVEELAAATGRGLRSAVGTYGFEHGGLIVDAGKKPGQGLGGLARRLPVPDEWRIVLFCPSGQQGLAGASEGAAFARLPPVSEETTRRLWAITTDSMLPALARTDCDAFGEAVYQFGRLAGECFSAVQGGPFASRQIAQLVDSIRAYGISGVGQSSWGPTVFAITASDEAAQRLAAWFRKQHRGSYYKTRIAQPNNTGATVNY